MCHILMEAFQRLSELVIITLERQALMKFTLEYEQEEDGRWLAEVLELPGVLAYGKSPDDAVAHAQALALRVVADRLENGESAPALMFSFAAA